MMEVSGPPIIGARGPKVCETGTYETTKEDLFWRWFSIGEKPGQGYTGALVVRQVDTRVDRT